MLLPFHGREIGGERVYRRTGPATRISRPWKGRSMSYSFNLLERPWIPCLTRQEIVIPLSLRETLARAHELLNITHESPLVGVSVMRLLLAVLHRVYGPRNAASWAILWRSPSFDMAALDGYFDQWRGRFDLFDAERPFYQDASCRKEQAAPVSKLMHETASGSNEIGRASCRER